MSRTRNAVSLYAECLRKRTGNAVHKCRCPRQYVDFRTHFGRTWNANPLPFKLADSSLAYIVLQHRLRCVSDPDPLRHLFDLNTRP